MQSAYPFESYFSSRPNCLIATLLKASHLKRPQYLDNDWRFAHPQSGNRAILLTVVSTNAHAFQGPAQRIHFLVALRAAARYEGCDVSGTERFRGGAARFFPAVREIYFQWQDRMAPVAGELQAISFAEPSPPAPLDRIGRAGRLLPGRFAGMILRI
jgi:hypothetical protein